MRDSNSTSVQEALEKWFRDGQVLLEAILKPTPPTPAETKAKKHPGYNNPRQRICRVVRGLATSRFGADYHTAWHYAYDLATSWFGFDPRTLGELKGVGGLDILEEYGLLERFYTMLAQPDKRVGLDDAPF